MVFSLIEPPEHPAVPDAQIVQLSFWGSRWVLLALFPVHHCGG
jgi:hypothetical protein